MSAIQELWIKATYGNWFCGCLILLLTLSHPAVQPAHLWIYVNFCCKRHHMFFSWIINETDKFYFWNRRVKSARWQQSCSLRARHTVNEWFVGINLKPSGREMNVWRITMNKSIRAQRHRAALMEMYENRWMDGCSSTWSTWTNRQTRPAPDITVKMLF